MRPPPPVPRHSLSIRPEYVKNRDEFARLEIEMRWRRCGICGGRINVGFGTDQEPFLRCKGWPEHEPLPERYGPRQEDAERRWNVTQLAIRTHNDVTDALAESVKKFLKLPEGVLNQDVAVFAHYCIANGLDPYSGDCFLVAFRDNKNGGYKCSIIKGVNVKVRRASKHPSFRTFRQGIITFNPATSQEEHHEGARLPTNQTLVGGWARFLLHGDDEGVYHAVDLKKYHRGMKGQRGTPWDEIPEEMIQKVALSQLASRFAGTTDESDEKEYTYKGETMAVIDETETTQIISETTLPAVQSVREAQQPAPVFEAAPPQFPHPDADTDASLQGECPTHATPFKLIPVGISRSTKRPYAAFWTCPEQGCNSNPKDWAWSKLKAIDPELLPDWKRVGVFMNSTASGLQQEYKDNMVGLVDAVHAAHRRTSERLDDLGYTEEQIEKQLAVHQDEPPPGEDMGEAAQKTSATDSR